MTETSPPPEAQRFGRSQTPESPRPVHIPEPSNIPVLLNQMDPVFNDTATYNIPHNQTFSPYPDSPRVMNGSNSEEQDAVQNFLRGAEEENGRFGSGAQFPNTNGRTTQNDASFETNLLSALAENSAQQAPEANSNVSHDASGQSHTVAQSNNESSTNEHNANASHGEPESPFQSDGARKSEQEPSVKSNAQSGTGGVDYQSLLDTISQSASTAPAADPVSAPTTAASHVDHGSSLSLPPVPGLPPKPPVQATPQESPSYYAFPSSTSDLRDQYQPLNPDALPVNGTESSTSGPVQPMIQNIPTQAPGTWNQNVAQVSPTNPDAGFVGHPLQQVEPSRSEDPDERPWSPRTQSLYDQFLEEERRYVTEGIWDRFPPGSRLFVGNLASEKVTKRDLFHVFHKHGRLAQISIKQAYGFVQYLEASSCQAALQAEQASEIRGRKIHLEVSKPQKNTRNQAQGNKRRRSRSPDRGNARQSDRHNRSNFNDFREEKNRRDDYRPARSPSPRNFRVRDDYRARAQSPRFSLDARQRSPFSSNFPPPLPAAYDEEATLPLPRRDPRDVPDVQLLILEPSVAQSFINWIEQGFRAKGLRASTIWLSPRLPLGAVVKRQIIEGVQAVVKLTQGNQYNSKIPLQVFDRNVGASNVNFNEYVDLDVPVAADIVLHARQKERGAAPPTPQAFPPPQGYSHGQYGQPPTHQYPPQLPPAFPQPQHSPPQLQYGQQPHYQAQYPTPVTPTASAPNLQQLLANLRQPGDAQSGIPQGERPTPNYTSYLGNGGRQNGPTGQFPPQAVATPQYPAQHQQAPAYGNAPAYGAGQQPQQNVQNIMDTLARYNR
ncbi:hypothetical protein A1O1_06145 [Capronia coronata CBS 617.96]|uniref:RRM domain-containing protein n=1 Tax=Capronia coronata CBS 617.96 TaxID=1182541 RepID=W9XYZ3_9EURO|nr:uncharacterized protein A1O1_06145 [Capronia coronata CBS 617.96]EXJ85777.1 hypothetical protein A1O1_06145 [Capronia coronata CBS 617.96]